MTTIASSMPRRPKPLPSFETEAAMTDQAIARAGAFWRGAAPFDAVALEAVGPGAVADVVFAGFDRGALAARDAHGILPVTDWTTLGCVLACRSRALALRELAGVLGTSESTVRRATGLAVAAGALVRGDDGFRTHRAWRPVARRLVAVELKLRDWAHGLGQASRYRDWADTSWLVLGASEAPSATAASAAAGIGLARLGADGSVRVLARPVRQRDFALRERVWIGEQALAQAMSSITAPAATFATVSAAAAG